MFLVYNSDILTGEAFHLLMNDRAFQYGDGLFETIRYENDQVWFWPDHMARLTAGMAALRLMPPPNFNETSVLQTIHELLSVNGLMHQPARIKLQVWRKPGGLYTPASQEINYLITAHHSQPFYITHKIKIGIYTDVKLSFSVISSFKTLNALPYVLAGFYRQEQRFDEVVLLNTEGYLAECVASNLFWFRGETLHTPSLQTGCINGIARRQFLRHFPTTEEGFYLPAMLNDAAVVFTANVMGIQVFGGALTSEQVSQINRIFMTISI